MPIIFWLTNLNEVKNLWEVFFSLRLFEELFAKWHEDLCVNPIGWSSQLNIITIIILIIIIVIMKFHCHNNNEKWRMDSQNQTSLSSQHWWSPLKVAWGCPRVSNWLILRGNDPALYHFFLHSHSYLYPALRRMDLQAGWWECLKTTR